MQQDITVDGWSVLETPEQVARGFRGMMHGARVERATLLEQARVVARDVQVIAELPPGALRQRYRDAAEARLDALAEAWPAGWRRLVFAALHERRERLRSGLRTECRMCGARPPALQRFACARCGAPVKDDVNEEVLPEGVAGIITPAFGFEGDER